MRVEKEDGIIFALFYRSHFQGATLFCTLYNISTSAKLNPNLVSEGGGVEMAGSTNLVVPIVLWGRSPPAHCISTVYLLRDQRTMVTGSHDGQVVVWQLEDTHTWQFTPRHMLIGHTAPVRYTRQFVNYA